MELYGTLDWYDVQKECIAHSWYTHGTCDDYDKLAENVERHNHNVNLADGKNAWYALTSFADDIKAHSDTEYSVDDIAQVLLSRVYWRFIDPVAVGLR